MSSLKRALRVLVFGVAVLVTLVAAFYAEENWRGRREWQKCRRGLEAKGVNLDWESRIPAPVPKEQNIFKAPSMSEWFVKAGTNHSSTLSEQAAAVLGCTKVQGSMVLAKVSIEPAAMVDPSKGPDIILDYRVAATPPVAQGKLEELGRVLGEAREDLAIPGPTLAGAQNVVFVLGRPKIIKPVQVVIRSDSVLKAAQVRGLFQVSAAAPAPGGQARLRLETKGDNQFEALLGETTTISAAEYLSCSDEFVPALDSIGSALERPYARPEGDYNRPWGIPIPNFVAIRSIAQVLSQRAQCHLLLGEPAKALDEMTLLHKLRRLLEGRPMTLVAAMIDVAVTGLYTSTLADGLRLHAWREPQLIALQHQVQELRLVPALVGAVDFERVASCHIFETIPTSELNSVFAFGGESLWSKLNDPAYLLARWMPRGWVYQNMKEIALQDQSFVEAVETNNIVKSAQVEQIGRRSIASMERLSPYTVLGRLAMPNYLKAFQTTFRNQAMANAAYLACALERFYLVSKEYPADLEPLVPALAESVPLDPINGGALKYRRLGPDRYLLYSVGWNETDDGGQSGGPITDGDWVWNSSHP